MRKFRSHQLKYDNQPIQNEFAVVNELADGKFSALSTADITIMMDITREEYVEIGNKYGMSVSHWGSFVMAFKERHICDEFIENEVVPRYMMKSMSDIKKV